MSRGRGGTIDGFGDLTDSERGLLGITSAEVSKAIAETNAREAVAVADFFDSRPANFDSRPEKFNPTLPRIEEGDESKGDDEPETSPAVSEVVVVASQKNIADRVPV